MKIFNSGLPIRISEPRSPEKTITAFRLLVAISLFAVISGCASLPNAPEVIGEVPADHEPPRITSARGQLTPAQSRKLMESLKHSVSPTDVLERQTAVIEAVSGSPLVKGNRVELLVNGPSTYAAMYKAIGNARFNINMETFIFEDDETGRRLADLLIRKRGEGVHVNLIYDSVGSLNTPASFFQRLRDKGINVVEFNPVNPLKAHGKLPVTMRDHRKILVVDGRIAITGGVNISGVYSSRFSGAERENKSRIPWRDTDVRIEGPAVAEFQKIFLRAWIWQKGPLLTGTDYFPELKGKGDDLVQVVSSSPGELGRTTFIMYVSAVTFAERTVHLTAAYFVPDEQMVDALVDAARRGVDVKIILPKTSDSPLALYAGRYYYDELLESGVKLYERRNAVLHAKTAVIDGVWSTVGSTNLDFWSFSENFEVNAVVLGSGFAGEMEKMFAGDLAESDRITEEKWDDRPLFSRVREWLAHLFAHML
jgi:cardiolipin synthase